MRIITDLPDTQIAAVANACAEENISRAEFIRRAVHEKLEKHQQQQPQNPLLALFGIWKDRTDIGDGVEYINRMRDEWEDRLKELYGDRYEDTFKPSEE